MRMLLSAVLLLSSASCTNSSTNASNSPAEKSGDFKTMSSAEIRRGLAAASPAAKEGAGFSADGINTYLFYKCDRKELPRTCCYATVSVGGETKTLSCTEENH